MQQTVALLGAQGYVGQALATLLCQHPHISRMTVFSRDPNWRIYHEMPVLSDAITHCLTTQLMHQLDQFTTLFLATPPEVSLECVPKLLEHGKTVIDMSGAFRLNADAFERWYQCRHSATDQLKQAVYGLSPWWQQASISPKPKLISNPGCYATCALMALLPLLKTNLIAPANIIIDAKSGISGAGKKAAKDLLFCEIADNFYPYKITTHQHLPEIAKYIQQFTQVDTQPLMITHILPLKTGISMSIYADLTQTLDSPSNTMTAIDNAYQNAYQDYPLAHFGAIQPNKPEYNKSLVALKQVRGSARVHIGYLVKGHKLFISACIDNLLKGAASQAIENFNTLHDLPISTGLDKLGNII